SQCRCPRLKKKENVKFKVCNNKNNQVLRQTFVDHFPGNLKNPFVFVFSAETVIKIRAIGKIDRIHARIKATAHAIGRRHDDGREYLALKEGVFGERWGSAPRCAMTDRHLTDDH